MRLLLIIFVFIVAETRFSNWNNYDDDDKKEKEVTCNFPEDGVQVAGQCQNHYYICNNKKRVTANCPEGLVYYWYKCIFKEDAPSCPEYKSDLDLYRSKNKTIRDSICKRRVDGHYDFLCENAHYSCKNETVTWHKCPKGLIYVHHHCLEDKCIKREHHLECCPYDVGYEGQDPRCPADDGEDIPRIKKLADPNKEFSCMYKYDGHYSAGRCLNYFHICIYFKNVTGYCPEGMVYWNDRCHFKRDVKHCPEYKTDLELYHSKNETEKNSICEIRADGNRAFPCENEYYECKMGKTIWKKCPPGEVFDEWWNCKKRVLHEKCPEYAKKHKTDLELYHSKNKTERNSICEIRVNGHYNFPCENEHYECKNGKTTWKKCPPGEVFDGWWSCKKRIHHADCPEFENVEVEEIDPNVEGRDWPDGSNFFIEE